MPRSFKLGYCRLSPPQKTLHKYFQRSKSDETDPRVWNQWSVPLTFSLQRRIQLQEKWSSIRINNSSVNSSSDPHYQHGVNATGQQSTQNNSWKNQLIRLIVVWKLVDEEQVRWGVRMNWSRGRNVFCEEESWRWLQMSRPLLVLWSWSMDY